MTQSEIKRRLNKLGIAQVLRPKGVLQEDELTMPIELILEGILESIDGTPGEDCQVTDWTVCADKITLRFQRGDFEREQLVPRKALEMFDAVEPDFE